MEMTEEMNRNLALVAPCTEPIRLQEIVERLKEHKALVLEVMEPEQAVDTTRIELCDLFLVLKKDKEELSQVGYGDAEIQRFQDSIVAMRSFEEMRTSSLNFGAFKVRTVQEVIEASKPWREKLRRLSRLAFHFEPTHLALYQDHNESRSLEEEVGDLRRLTEATVRDAEPLAKVKWTAADTAKGQQLLHEAEGRDLLALIGIRNQDDARLERNHYLTLAVVLARHARVAGEACFWDDPKRRAPYERATFRKALRRLHPERSGAGAGPVADGVPVVEPETPAEP